MKLVLPAKHNTGSKRTIDMILNNLHALYIGWSDVTVMWTQHDLYVVGQHGVLREVKWQIESAGLKNMSVLSLSYNNNTKIYNAHM